jgi:hypothetical protein
MFSELPWPTLNAATSITVPSELVNTAGGEPQCLTICEAVTSNLIFRGRYTTASPYYGAYTATAAMAGGSYIFALDPGNTAYAAYIIYDSAKKPLKALLYNSDYYSGSGTRGTESFVLTGLGSGTLRSKRLTAANSNSRVDQGSNPTFGGQTFANGTCVVGGTEIFESSSISGGQAAFTVAASEALLVYLQ